VTTALDEDDADATPASPGGTGFSLQEAIRFANANVGHETIAVSSMTIVLIDALPWAATTDGFTIAGDGHVLIDATAESTSTIGYAGSNHEIYGLEIFGAGANGLLLESVNSWLHDVYVHSNNDGILVAGPGWHIGPNVEVAHNTASGIRISQTLTLVDRCRIHHNGTVGIDDPNPGTVVQLTLIYSNGGDGVYAGAGSDDVTFWSNTFHANGGSGLALHTAATGITAQNNIFSANSAWGVSGKDTNFSTNTHNVFTVNLSGACSACTPDAPTTMMVDPLYRDAAADDLGLLPSSPLIDTGIDLGIDTNGAGPGDFFGTAPDRGALETFQQ
jgi:hypothetical protein